MASWTREEFEVALAAYGHIISPKDVPADIAYAAAIVKMLESDYRGDSEFLAFSERLPVLVFKEKLKPDGIKTKVRFNIESKRHKNIITEIASGNVGTVYSGSAEFDTGLNIYKKIVLTKDLNKSIREVFLETWIQTVLSLDASMVDKIGKVRGLYRAAPAAAVGAGGAGGPAPSPSVTLYIVMEPAGMPLKTIISRPFTFITMKPIYRELGILLQHLQRKYGFYHRDLHRGNVLRKDDSISLIDFGESVIKKWDGLGTYRSTAYDGALGPEGPYSLHSSFDLLKFLTSMIDYHADEMTEEHKGLLIEIIGKDIFASIRRIAGKRIDDSGDPDYLFWQTSPSAYSRFTGPEAATTGLIMANPTLRPAGFIDYLDHHKGGGRKIRKTQKKKNRGTRGRR